MLEVYDVSAEEAMEVWRNIRGESAAWGEYREFANRSLKYWVEESLKDAVDRKIGVGWYVRGDGRTGHRNGYYERLLVTPYGSVTVRVPRVREGGYEHDLSERQHLFTAEVGELIAVACMRGDFEDMLSVFDLPEEDRVMMRTTNGIERVFREVRRRTRTISCFTNRRSIDRMIYALLTRQNRI